jgi:hypothetical protein
VVIPPDAPRGPYRIVLGVLEPDSGRRLHRRVAGILPTWSRSVELGTFEVAP